MQITKNPHIEVKNMSFKYDDIFVLKNINFSVEAGDYLGIIGPNGGGKSTLIKILLGLLKPTSGTVKIFGEDAGNLKMLIKIGYVPQKIARGDGDFQFPATVEEIVLSGTTPRRGLFKALSKEDKVAIETAMEITEVASYRKKSINKLSGGERQRVFIARALAGSPDILILDEPVVGVDIYSQEKFYAFLKDINKKLGLTIIFISHDIDVITSQVKSILCLNHELVCNGHPEEFIKKEYMEKLYGKKVKFVLHEH